MTREIRSLAVYCGSSTMIPERYRQVARELGRTLASRDIQLVYGGGNVGLMNEVAESVWSHGGRVLGVITERLMEIEVGREAVSELIVVPDMHTRKRIMCDRSDAFVGLPGGYGTLDEIFEAVTWTQLNVHRKPVGLLDTDDYYAHLEAFLDRCASDGFIRPRHRALLQRFKSVDSLLDGLAESTIPEFGKWITTTSD